MRVVISLELDVEDMTESGIHDYLADLTYEMRVSRRLQDWYIAYDVSEGRK